jgi:hypothetical protein
MASDDLITLSRAQQNPALASVDPTYLALLISSASIQLQNWARRCFVSQKFTESFDGEGDQTLFLKNYPITNIEQVDFVDMDGTVNIVMANGADFTKYFFIGDGGEIDFILNNPGGYERFPRGFKNVKIIYTAGYSPIPEDIQEACAEQIVFINDQGSANSSIKSEKLGDFSQSFFDQGNSGGSNDLSKTAFQLLSPYRDMGF